MTVYTLMSGVTVPVNAPNGVAPSPVSVPGAPTKARFLLSLSGTATAYAQATVTATQPGYTNSTQQVIYDPILVLTIPPGAPNSISQELRFGAPYNSFSAQLNDIARGQQTSATLTMTV